MTLVSTNWLEENLSKVKIIDASWHLVKNRNAIEEYNKEHIENTIFFDLDKNSNKKKNLPHGHFLPSESEHEKNISELGISNTDKIIIYCYSDLISSCRVWFQFLYFGHDPKLVSVLNGGMKKWKLEGKKVTNLKTKIISYEDVTRLFFKIHDPTTLNRQGPNVGHQYRSEIFYTTEEERKSAQKVLDEVNKKLDGKVVTVIRKEKNYCKAEEYHQKYFEKQSKK